MTQITDKYDVDSLDKVLAFFSTKKPGEFIFPNHLKKILPGHNESSIEMILIGIASFDSSILTVLPRNNMYHHPIQKGTYLDTFLSKGGFTALKADLNVSRLNDIEHKKIEREYLEAAPDTVRVAAEANRLSNAANMIAIQNK
jgi:hypothetical protein